MRGMITSLSRWLRGDRQSGADALASLILAARDDAAFRDRLVFLLRLPATQREPLVHTAIEEMRLRGEPAAARAAFAILATKSGAQTALRLLERE